MRISPINFNIPIRQTPFGSTNRRTYIYKDGTREVEPYLDRSVADYAILGRSVLCSNHTKFCREDLPWHLMKDLIDENFSSKGKVNVYNFACSDGSEPYSLAIALIEQYGYKTAAKRFFPIKASDIDEQMIKVAKEGKIYATFRDFERFSLITNNVRNYFDIEEIDDESYIMRPKKILKKAVQFKTQDVEDGIDEVKSSNSLIMARNFWRYLPCDKFYNVCEKLSKKVDDSSKIFIGNFDMPKGRIPSIFERFGFTNASDLYGEEFIMEKREGYETYKDCDQAEFRNLIKQYCSYAK